MSRKKRKEREERNPDYISHYERAYRILEYLRWNSDREHPVTQASLRKVEELERYMGGKETFREMLLNMVGAMNFAEHDVKPKAERPLCYKEFESVFGDAGDDGSEADRDDSEEDDFDWRDMRITGLHYQHIFTYEEINRLIESVLFSATLSSEGAKALINKIERHLTTKFYQSGMKKICRVIGPQLVDRSHLQENLSTLQKAIDERVQVCFQFNTYDRDKKLVPLGRGKDTVSPYYIVANGGRYYLIACKELQRDDKPVRNMSIWRVDLMTEITIPGQDRGKSGKGVPALDKRKVENLPAKWDEEFHHSHLNMSFDKPVPVWLRVSPVTVPTQGTEKSVVNYTFLHDWFGDHFRYIRTEKEPPYADIVRVECSPYAMANWAMQYSDRVEVLEPKGVRDAVIKRIQDMSQKYQIELSKKEK